MSNGKNPESMDEVLASLRRIVHTEDDAKVGAKAGARVGAKAGASLDAAPETTGEDAAPLLLTPEMRSDGGMPVSGTDASAADAEVVRKMVRAILAEELADGDAEGAVRDIVRDELTNGEVGDSISRNVLQLVRSEIAKALADR